ncbi:hypothetical protein [Salinigranum rubrum]|uniref:hypothetical protein n=1 Tax=Salinigranum rubrum TaxID=755307 RepID=UPI0013A56AD8|nr:hypothetical protein [Salinigranum rubrum]
MQNDGGSPESVVAEAESVTVVRRRGLDVTDPKHGGCFRKLFTGDGDIGCHDRSSHREGITLSQARGVKVIVESARAGRGDLAQLCGLRAYHT